MNTLTKIFTSCFFCLIAALTHAQTVSYNFAEARYLNSDNGGDGVEIGGSFQFDAEWVVMGHYSTQSFDGDVDLDVFEIGVGYVLPEINGYSLLASASFVNAEVSAGPFDDDDNGVRLAFGARNLFTERVEGRASINFNSAIDNDLFFEVGGDYFVTPRLAAGAEVQLGSETDTVSIGVRWHYGRLNR